MGVVPTRLPEDITSRRLYFAMGVVALIAEMALATWVFVLRGVPPLFGAIGAVLVTLVFDAVLHLLFFSKEPRPKEALRR